MCMAKWLLSRVSRSSLARLMKARSLRANTVNGPSSFSIFARPLDCAAVTKKLSEPSASAALSRSVGSSDDWRCLPQRERCQHGEHRYNSQTLHCDLSNFRSSEVFQCSVILSGAVFQAKRRISVLTVLARKPMSRFSPLRHHLHHARSLPPALRIARIHRLNIVQAARKLLG